MTPHNLPTLGQAEVDAAAGVIASGWIAQGKEVSKFEEELAEFLGLPSGHVVAVSSGTAALFLALHSLGAHGKRVGVPVYSCSSLRNAVGMAQAKPIFLDCQPQSPNIDASNNELTSDEVLILPSMFGIPAFVPTNPSGPKIIEDIAQAIGARSTDERIGSRGHIGVCSFYATKLITSGGQGGAVFSRDKSLIDGIRDYREFDCRDDKVMRFNFQMTDIHASIGRVQLAKLPGLLARREQIFSIYRSAGVTLLDSCRASDKSACFRAVVHSKNPSKLIQTLEKSGVRAIVPIESRELLDTPSQYPNAWSLSQTTVSIPCYPSLADQEVIRIASIIREIET